MAYKPRKPKTSRARLPELPTAPKFKPWGGQVSLGTGGPAGYEPPDAAVSAKNPATSVGKGGGLFSGINPLLSEAELRKKALALIGPILDAQKQSIESTQKQRGADINAAYAALAQIARQQAPVVQGAYQNAANATGTFAKGFTNQVTADQAAAAAGQQANLGPNSPQSVTSGFTQGGGDALYATGGYIPASTLAREGAAFTSAASMFPQTAMGLGVQAQKSLAAQSLQQIQELEARRPELLLQALESLRQNDMQRRVMSRTERLEQLEFGAKKKAGRGIQSTFQDAYGRQVALYADGTTKVLSGAAPAGSPEIKSTFVGPDGSVTAVYDDGSSGVVAPPGSSYVPGKGKGKRGGTAKDYAKTKKDAFLWAQAGVTPKWNNESGSWTPGTGIRSYKDALVSLVNGYGLKLADAMKILNGIYDPDNFPEGHPLGPNAGGESSIFVPGLTPQQVTMLRAKGVPLAVVMEAMWAETDWEMWNIINPYLPPAARRRVPRNTTRRKPVRDGKKSGPGVPFPTARRPPVEAQEPASGSGESAW